MATRRLCISADMTALPPSLPRMFHVKHVQTFRSLTAAATLSRNIEYGPSSQLTRTWETRAIVSRTNFSIAHFSMMFHVKHWRAWDVRATFHVEHFAARR